MKINKGICIYGVLDGSNTIGFTRKLEQELRKRNQKLPGHINVGNNIGTHFAQDMRSGFDRKKEIAIRFNYGYKDEVPTIIQFYEQLQELNVEDAIQSVSKNVYVVDPINYTRSEMCFFQPSLMPFSGLVQGRFWEESLLEEQENKLHIQGYGDVKEKEIEQITKLLAYPNIKIINYLNQQHGNTYSQKHQVGESFGSPYPRISMDIKWTGANVFNKSIKIFQNVREVVLPTHLETIASKEFQDDIKKRVLAKENYPPFSNAQSGASLVDYNLSAFLDTKIPFVYKNKPMEVHLWMQDRNRQDLMNHFDKRLI